MGRIGRNELCPCGSGSKYKRCCLRSERFSAAVSPVGQFKISLLVEIERIQKFAADSTETVRELGVFVLWSDAAGSAWLLEIAESDAVQVAEAGRPLDVPIDENPETIAINWSHTFAVRDRQFFLTAYEDKQESCLEDAPVKRINVVLKRIHKKYSEEQLSRVHIHSTEEAQEES